MAQDPEVHLAAGNGALQDGQWAQAREAFVSALAVAESAEAHAGLAEASWWLGDMNATMSGYERAYALFLRGGEHDAAALLALRIGFHSAAHMANDAAAAGWIARGRRLIERHELAALQGELLLMDSYLAADAVAAEERAQAALAEARRTGDADLELCALSSLGVALVRQGRERDGMALLDESMAGCLGGEAVRRDTVVFASCNMMTSCARCAALERAVQWVRAAERFARQHGCPFLHADCRVVYGSVLVAAGRWKEAEPELLAAINLTRSAAPTYHAAALTALADLRVRQGRLEEAERLLEGIETSPAAAEVVARIRIGQGNHEDAAAVLHRRLEAYVDSGPAASALLELLGEVELVAGDRDAALRLGDTLLRAGDQGKCSLVAARGRRLTGRALMDEDPSAARVHLDAALAEFDRIGMRYESAVTRLHVASTLRQEPAAAVAEAGAALGVLEELGAAPVADAASALLRDLGAPPARTGRGASSGLTRRETDVLRLLGEGLSNPAIADRLFISRKTVEHHVSRVLAKLGLRSRAEAAAFAMRRHYEQDPIGE